MDDTASVWYFRIHLTTPRLFYFQHKSSTHLAHNWHKLAHIWHKLAHNWHTTSTPNGARHRSRFDRHRCPGRNSYELATPSDLIAGGSNPYPLRYRDFHNFWATFARLWKFDLKIYPEVYLNMPDVQKKNYGWIRKRSIYKSSNFYVNRLRIEDASSKIKLGGSCTVPPQFSCIVHRIFKEVPEFLVLLNNQKCPISNFEN